MGRAVPNILIARAGFADTVDGIRAEWLIIDRIVAEDKATGILMVQPQTLFLVSAVSYERGTPETPNPVSYERCFL